MVVCVCLCVECCTNLMTVFICSQVKYILASHSSRLSKHRISPRKTSEALNFFFSFLFYTFFYFYYIIRQKKSFLACLNTYVYGCVYIYVCRCLTFVFYVIRMCSLGQRDVLINKCLIGATIIIIIAVVVIPCLYTYTI